jgi:hypothetical protein
MCFGGNTPAPQQAPAPPPPEPMEAPAAPVFNEETNADNLVTNARRGRKSLRVDLNSGARSAAPTTGAATSAASGLNIPA